MDLRRLLSVVAVVNGAFALHAGYTAGETLWETNFPAPRVFRLERRGNDKMAIHALPRLSGPVLVEAVVKGTDVTRGPNGWNGPKVMLSYRKADGTGDNPQLRGQYGTYDWQTWSVVKAFPASGADVSLTLGLEECTGEFQVKSVKISRAVETSAETMDPVPVDPTLPRGKFLGSHNPAALRGVMSGRDMGDEAVVELADWGVKLVRLQISGLKDAGSPEAYQKALAEKLVERKAVVDRLWAKGIRTVLDLHQGPGCAQNKILQNRLPTDYDTAELCRAWVQIASVFKGHPGVWGYDILNEPICPEATWKRICRDVIAAVRKVDSETPFVMSIPDTRAFDYYIPNEKVIYSPHYYSPHALTHQGVINEGMLRWSYPGIIEGERWDREAIRQHLRPVIDFQLRHPDARIYVGEFSCIPWVKGDAEYVRDCISVFEEYGWDWTYHAYREWPGWDVDYDAVKEYEKKLYKPVQPSPRKRFLLEGLGRGIPFYIQNGTNTILVTAVAGECSKVSAVEDGILLEVVDPQPNKWPAVHLMFEGSRDLGSVGEIRARVRNPKKGELQKVGLKVKAVTQQGQTPGMMAGVRFGTQTMRLPLKIEQYVFDKDPQLKGLKRHPKVVDGSSYTLDKTTSVTLFLMPMSEGGRFIIESVEFIPSSDKREVTVLKVDELGAWVDEFGQAAFAEFPAKIHSVQDLKDQYARESAELAEKPNAIPDVDEYGGWKGGPQLQATGHFRTERVDGKWWLVDPSGHLYFAQGMNCGWDMTPTAIQYREEYFQKLPPREGETAQFWKEIKQVAYRNYYSDPARVPYWAFSFQRYNLWRKYGDDYIAQNEAMMGKRCRSWGINCLTGAPKGLRAATKIPYHVSLSPTSRKIEGAKGYWGEMLDPYASEFAKNCVGQAEWLKESKDDPYCLGCTVHNELSWGRNGATLAKSILAAPDDQPAKIALCEILAKRGKTVETADEADLRALGQAFAEQYYSTVRAAIKRVAPDMLYLGDRNDKRNPETFKAAAKYCDVVTVNVYDYQASVELPAEAEDKPLWVTEFHFGCYDTGYFYASLMPVANQEERAACYRNYLLSAIDSPSYVGANWFCWRDQPITGVIGESANSSCGVVSVTDIPYRELTDAMRVTAAEMYTRRFGVATD